jgi:hypothetical protein
VLRGIENTDNGWSTLLPDIRSFCYEILARRQISHTVLNGTISPVWNAITATRKIRPSYNSPNCNTCKNFGEWEKLLLKSVFWDYELLLSQIAPLTERGALRPKNEMNGSSKLDMRRFSRLSRIKWKAWIWGHSSAWAIAPNCYMSLRKSNWKR